MRAFRETFTGGLWVFLALHGYVHAGPPAAIGSPRPLAEGAGSSYTHPQTHAPSSVPGPARTFGPHATCMCCLGGQRPPAHQVHHPCHTKRQATPHRGSGSEHEQPQALCHRPFVCLPVTACRLLISRVCFAGLGSFAIVASVYNNSHLMQSSHAARAAHARAWVVYVVAVAAAHACLMVR